MFACTRRVGTICHHGQFVQRDLEEFQECFNSTTRGYTMPAFSFEKISPPIRRGPVPAIAKKQRASSFRFWIVSSKPASSGRCAEERSSSPAAQRNPRSRRLP